MSFIAARRPSNTTSRYLPLARTQCAAVSTRSGATATPVHTLLPPTISTTCRAIVWSAGIAPPTMAEEGTDDSISHATVPRARHAVVLFSIAVGIEDTRLGTPPFARDQFLRSVRIRAPIVQSMA